MVVAHGHAGARAVASRQNLDRAVKTKKDYREGKDDLTFLQELGEGTTVFTKGKKGTVSVGMVSVRDKRWGIMLGDKLCTLTEFEQLTVGNFKHPCNNIFTEFKGNVVTLCFLKEKWGFKPSRGAALAGGAGGGAAAGSGGGTAAGAAQAGGAGGGTAAGAAQAGGAGGSAAAGVARAGGAGGSATAGVADGGAARKRRCDAAGDGRRTKKSRNNAPGVVQGQELGEAGGSGVALDAAPGLQQGLANRSRDPLPGAEDADAVLAENRESTQRLNEFVRKLQAELYSTREEQRQQEVAKADAVRQRDAAEVAKADAVRQRDAAEAVQATAERTAMEERAAREQERALKEQAVHELGVERAAREQERAAKELVERELGEERAAREQERAAREQERAAKELVERELGEERAAREQVERELREERAARERAKEALQAVQIELETEKRVADIWREVVQIAERKGGFPMAHLDP